MSDQREMLAAEGSKEGFSQAFLKEEWRKASLGLRRWFGKSKKRETRRDETSVKNISIFL